MKTVALIMAGGRGERFWPDSRNNKPKQFLSFTSDGITMIQSTIKRIEPLIAMEDIYILTNKNYAQLINEQIPFVPKENIIFEPVSKNTAPAIELGVEKIKEKYDDVSIIVLASDHFIKNEKEFLKCLEKATDFVSKNEAIVTLGIKPTEPNTGYGYIHLDNKNEIHKVLEFKEKPSLDKAKEYLNEGNYVWNSGMFIFSLKTIDKCFAKYMPKQYEILSKDVSRFAEVEAISIDYGVMEKANNIYCIEGDFGWDDVGSYAALSRTNKVDENGNCVLNSEVELINTNNTTIKGTGKKLIATLGLDNVVIVETDDVILVANKDELGDIKKIKSNLADKKKDKYL